MNMNALMQQAQKMQKDMQAKQEQINNTNYDGTSELVDVVLKGDKKIVSIKFKNMDNFDKDDLDVLEDMIKIAINDAIAKIEKDFDAKLGVYGKQLGGLF